jgi:cell division protein FtsZ
LYIGAGTKEVTMDEIGSIIDYVQNHAGFEADIIWGCVNDESLGNKISVTLIATGFGQSSIPKIIGNNNAKPMFARTHAAPKRNEIYTKKTVADETQRTIEFTVANATGQDDDMKFESLYPQTGNARNTSGKKEVVMDYSVADDEIVDEIENIPAYKRRHLRMNDPAYNKNNFSRCVVTSENNISEKNSHIHKKVD